MAILGVHDEMIFPFSIGVTRDNIPFLPESDNLDQLLFRTLKRHLFIDQFRVSRLLCGKGLLTGGLEKTARIWLPSHRPVPVLS